MAEHIIDLVPADPSRRHYGILMVSATRHRFTGPKIHNPSYDHVLQVWEHKPNPDGFGDGDYIDPFGAVTKASHSFHFSAQPIIIALHPAEREPEGAALRIGDTVEVRVNGYPLGVFEVDAKFTHNPHLVLVERGATLAATEVPA